ncbi:hypothetical protein N825_19380 [Skermanella stibiiresistens SB22]|uniref:SMP-30/Gluconolactonase/LRE-like region domain-containing protein n=1 Tax=Skermanella stibiiresistens SB22 TaxID=1385369 RepID=W9H8I9_9PROT|nr:hypothetical protein [Skermanella stibiiresistens]EWY42349.1 hypothetical protein N825_19380 [Skermanella stibiiresistens SB22]
MGTAAGGGNRVRLAAAGLIAAFLAASPAFAKTCEPVTLIDDATGRTVVGAEDMALDPGTGLVVVSAYDRLADGDPGGGLRVIDLATLEPGSLKVRDLAAGTVRRPHGIDLFEARRLFVIDRRDGGAEDTVVRIMGMDGGRTRTVEDPLLCRANDIAGLDGDRFLFTADHGSCGGVGVAIENVFGLERGFVGYFDGSRVRAVAPGLDFPNGIVVDPERGEVTIALTRGRSLRVFALDELIAGKPPRRTIPLDGAPDNLSRDQGGGVLVAIHPSLWRLALYRYGLPGSDRAPSRVEEISRDGDRRRVFEDDGTRLSAATVAVRWRGRMLIGSVRGDHVSLCR